LQKKKQASCRILQNQENKELIVEKTLDEVITEVRLYEMHGRLVLKAPLIEQRTTIHLGNLPPGIYLLRCDKETFNVKLP
jgi:hypothetical protein